MNRASLARRTRLWFPPMLVMVAIYAFSSVPDPMPKVTANVWDKALHAVEYGGLAVLLARALAGEGLTALWAVIVATVAASAYGATDEYHQFFVPQRSSDVRDWVADTIGAAIGAVIYVTAAIAVFRKNPGTTVDRVNL